MNWWLVATIGVLVAVGAWWALHVPELRAGQLQGQRVVICGASQGIGRALALEYAKFGAHLVLVARSGDLLQQVAQAVTQLHPQLPKPKVIAADLSKPAECKRVIEEANTALGGIDVLLMNHIRPFLGTFESMSDEVLQDIIDTNFVSYVYLAKYALPHLKSSHGSLAAVSSVAGKIPVPYTALYSGLKHALHGLFDSVRSEMIHLNTTSGVSITTCVIGLVDTESQRRISKGILDNKAGVTPEAVATAIVKNVAARVETMYFPALEGMPVAVLYRLAPKAWDFVIRAFMGKVA